MNVRELIAELEKLEDKEMEVMYDDNEYGPEEISNIGLSWANRITKDKRVILLW